MSHSIFAIIVLAASLLPAPVSAYTYYTSEPGSCVIIGDTDLYGIGIRLGLYLQWLAIFLACLLSPPDAISSFIASNVLTSSIFIGFLSGDWDRGIVIVEWFLVLHETSSLYAGLILLIVCCYGSLKNCQMMWLTLSVSYGTVASVSPYILIVYGGKGRKEGCHNPLDSVSPTMSAVVLCFVALLGLLLNFRPLVQRIARKVDASTLRFSKRRIFGGRGLQSYRFKLLSVIIAVVFGILFITRVENTLVRAEIDTSVANLKDTSQLIPFLSGLFNLVYICYCGWDVGPRNWPIRNWYIDFKETTLQLLYVSFLNLSIGKPMNWLWHRNCRSEKASRSPCPTKFGPSGSSLAIPNQALITTFVTDEMV
ncbi:hypothetical protein MMC28_003870 [Mycoblastus sanguinarius]|nr:hypothetical protein [Mycoblastus sanguinarius]